MTSGWAISGTSILQSGYPFTVFTQAPFCLTETAGTVLRPGSACGDFNADGDNYDYPNVTNYTQNTSRQAWLNGTVFQPGQFTTPTLGTEGNELWGQFRGPRFAETDAALLKNTAITERVNLQLRFEFFNIFNHPNLNFFNALTGSDQPSQADLSSSTFGRVTGQALPRWIQIGANLTF